MFALRHLFTHYYVILIFQIDDGRQMVTVTVQPSPAPMRTQGGTFVFAILLNQIIADENFIVIIAQPFLSLQQRFRNDNLVKQVPLAPIEQCPHIPCLPVSPTRDCRTDRLSSPAIGYLRAPSSLHAFIHRVVIHIPHHDELQLLVATHQRVLQGLYLPGCMHTHR